MVESREDRSCGRGDRVSSSLEAASGGGSRWGIRRVVRNGLRPICRAWRGLDRAIESADYSAGIDASILSRGGLLVCSSYCMLVCICMYVYMFVLCLSVCLCVFPSVCTDCRLIAGLLMVRGTGLLLRSTSQLLQSSSC